MNLGYITNGRNKLNRERIDYPYDNETPRVKVGVVELRAKRKTIKHDLAILDSYNLGQMEISYELEQELLARGMSQGERVCTGCKKIIKDEGFCRCEPCRIKQRKSANNYYNLKTKVRK